LADFEHFTRTTLIDNPDILALNFNPLVRQADRGTFETRMRRLLPGGHFEIWERDQEGRPVRAGSRPEYSPVTYIAPREKNQAVLGFDNYSEPVRRAATERVRTSRRMAVAAPILLVQEETPRIGMLQMVPVEDSAPWDAGEKPPLLGYVVAVVRIDQLIAIATQGEIPTGIRLELSDTRPQDPAPGPNSDDHERLGSEQPTGLIYRSEDGQADRIAQSRLDSWQRVLNLDDREWILTVSATAGYLQQHRSWAAWAVGVAGLVFAALLQVLMLGMTGRAHLIQRQNTALQAEIAERRLAAQALRKSEERYRDLNSALERKVEERTVELRHANAELQRLATTDSLTGAWNRLYFEQSATFEIARSHRYGDPLSMLLFDLDLFKAVNDVYGHPVGDKVLIELVERVRRQLRATDVLVRWGGEEFVVLLPHCAAEQAMTLAEKVRLLIATEPFPTVGRLTASFGVAEFSTQDTLDSWLKRVDAALYSAKAGGRNRAFLGEPGNSLPDLHSQPSV
jgi:diguanylate cyclase (GGDEF)-like protein